jgi:hypothetical protein
MPQLSNPTLNIRLIAGTSNVEITASVKVNFFPNEEAIMKLFPLVKYTMSCRLFGEDGGLNGADDPLFLVTSVGSKKINADKTHSFKRTVNRDSLDEDWEGNDEIYARFRCTAPTNAGFALNSATPKDSGTITGNF